jgi:TonB family protein
MRKSLASTLIGIALSAGAQNPTITVTPAPQPSPIPQFDKGVIENGAYKNPSLGLELTPTIGLTFTEPELKGTPGSVPLLVTVSAWAQPNLASPRDGVVFYADALAYYPGDQRSTDAYNRKVVRGNEKEGFVAKGSTQTQKLGDLAFDRTDFTKGLVYEAVFVKACRDQAYVFIFAGAEQGAVSNLIKGTDVKIDLPFSGCSSELESGGSNASLPSLRVCRYGDGTTGPCIKPGRPTYSPPPEYTEEARQAKIQGTVVLQMVLGTDGRPRDIKVVQSLGHGLDEKAVQALSEWKFEPSIKDGKPVQILTDVEMDFHLR